jgi:hypothetical protein
MAKRAKQIWKFPIVLKDRNWLTMPRGARFITAQIQDHNMCVWAHVQPEAQSEPVRVDVVGTGHDYDADGMSYLATMQQGPFVWHVFVPEECR